MKAVILAAGKGTRMRELTQALPKPMLAVQGKPILQRIIEGLRDQADIRQFCVITGHRAETIESFFGDGRQFAARIEYLRQETPEGTGKAAALAQSFVGADAFLLSYGDILVQPETYRQARDRFESAAYDGLVTVVRGADVTQGGLNFFDANFCLAKLVEKPSRDALGEFRARGWLQPGQPIWYNAGIYVFTPRLFDFTARLARSPRGEYELPDAINGWVEAGAKIAGLEIAGRWADVRDPETLSQVQEGSS